MAGASGENVAFPSVSIKHLDHDWFMASTARVGTVKVTLQSPTCLVIIVTVSTSTSTP